MEVFLKQDRVVEGSGERRGNFEGLAFEVPHNGQVGLSAGLLEDPHDLEGGVLVTARMKAGEVRIQTWISALQIFILSSNF